jgi:MOSC domain-containing protein YiiM
MGAPGSLRALMKQRHAPGRLTAILVRPARGAAMRSLAHAELVTERGLAGDYASQRQGGKRQVSLLQAEHLTVIAALVGRVDVVPELVRRNLVIEGISVLAFRAALFRIGDTLLRGGGTCEPCSKMESNLGQGGYNALRGHGGIVARVVRGGPIRLGDIVDFAESEEDDLPLFTPRSS